MHRCARTVCCPPVSREGRLMPPSHTHTQAFCISLSSQGLSRAKLRIWFHLKSQRYFKPVKNSEPWWAGLALSCVSEEHLPRREKLEQNRQTDWIISAAGRTDRGRSWGRGVVCTWASGSTHCGLFIDVSGVMGRQLSVWAVEQIYGWFWSTFFKGIISVLSFPQNALLAIKWMGTLQAKN